jgi:hypothetical protein
MSISFSTLSLFPLLAVNVLTHADTPNSRFNGPRPPKQLGSNERPLFIDQLASERKGISLSLGSGGRS